MDDDELYGFNENDVQRLSRLLGAWENGRLNQEAPLPERFLGLPLPTKIALTTSNIPAINGSKPGSGTANFYAMDFASAVLEVGPETDVTIYNIFDSKVYAGEWVLLVRDPGSGQYFIASEGAFGSSSSSSSDEEPLEVEPCCDTECPCCPGLVVPEILLVTITGGGDTIGCNGSFLIYRNLLNIDTPFARYSWTPLLNIGDNAQAGPCWSLPADADGNGSYFIFQCEDGGDRETGGFGWTLDNDPEGIIFCDSFDAETMTWVFTLSISGEDECDCTVPATLTITVPDSSWVSGGGFLSGTFP